MFAQSNLWRRFCGDEPHCAVCFGIVFSLIDWKVLFFATFAIINKNHMSSPVLSKHLMSCSLIYNLSTHKICCLHYQEWNLLCFTFIYLFASVRNGFHEGFWTGRMDSTSVNHQIVVIPVALKSEEALFKMQVLSLKQVIGKG